MNEISLSQHRAGKKHAARLCFFQANHAAYGATFDVKASGNEHAWRLKNVESQNTAGTLNIGPQ